jgi:hypothetical protein
MTTSHDLYHDLDRVAETVADQGLDAVDPSLVDAVAARALMLGASTTLVDILVDPDEPTVARIRAFGRLAMIAARPVRDRFALAA